MRRGGFRLRTDDVSDDLTDTGINSRTDTGINSRTNSGIDSGIDSGLEMQRAEAGRAGEQDDIDAAVDELLVGVDADEFLVRLHIDTVGELLREAGEAAVDLLHVHIRHGDDLAIVLSTESL